MDTHFLQYYGKTPKTHTGLRKYKINQNIRTKTMKKITTGFSENLLVRLDGAVKKMNITRSRFIRNAINLACDIHLDRDFHEYYLKNDDIEGKRAYNKKHVKITVTIPERQLDVIDEISEQLGYNRSEFISAMSYFSAIHWRTTLKKCKHLKLNRRDYTKVK